MERYLWLVHYWVPMHSGVEPFNDGVIPVVAKNQYEAIGKALTIDEMRGIPVATDSIRVEKLRLLHPEDETCSIKLEVLVDPDS